MKETRFINIPYTILGDVRLSQTEKMVYGFINGFAKGKCTAGNEFIAQTLSVSSLTIKRSTAKLEKLKLIHKSLRFNGGRCVGKVMTIYDARSYHKPTKIRGIIPGLLGVSLTIPNTISINSGVALSADADADRGKEEGSIAYKATLQATDEELHRDGYVREDKKLFNRFNNTEIK